jgi:hypothetical protein
MNKNIPIAVIAGTMMLAGCATTGPSSIASDNPPPAEAFARFNAFELKPLDTGEGCNKQHGAKVALASVQEQLDQNLGSIIDGWNAAGAKNTSPRKLVIEPMCTDVRLVGIQGRIWGGAFAGDSVIAMKVRYIDAATQRTVAEPSFYQHASAMGAAWSFGASDRSMATRVVDLVADYTRNNYQQVVGGPSGR